MFKDKKKHKKEEQQQKPTIVDRNKFTNQKGAGGNGRDSKNR